jgi:hypothetical protein
MKRILRSIIMGVGLAVIASSFVVVQAASNSTFQMSILDEQCYIDLVEGGGDPYIFVQPEDCPGPPAGDVPLPPIVVPPSGEPFRPDAINQIPLEPDELPPAFTPESPETPSLPDQAVPAESNFWWMFFIILGLMIVIFLLLNAISLALGGPGFYWLAGRRRPPPDQNNDV